MTRKKILLSFFLLVFIWGSADSLDRPSHQEGRCDRRGVYMFRTECAARRSQVPRCPAPAHSVGRPKRGCRYVTSRGTSRVGYDVMCRQRNYKAECCPDFYGPECSPCPIDFRGLICGGHGSCRDRMEGNGTCSCEAGITGSVCDRCVRSGRFGPACDQICKCVHGECNSGVDRDGSCLCYSGYTGPTCATKLVGCGSVTCGAHQRCDVTNKCVCDYGYVMNVTSECVEVHSCDSSSTNLCHRNATCFNTAPAKYICKCVEGYEGDGHFCRPIDNCLVGNGGCDPDSTCIYTGPATSKCGCKRGYREVDEEGKCELIDLCGTSPRYSCGYAANCTTVHTNGYIHVDCKCPRDLGLGPRGRTCYGDVIREARRADEGYSYAGNVTSRDNKFLGMLTSAIGNVTSQINMTSWSLRYTVFLPLTSVMDERFAQLSVEEKRLFALSHVFASDIYLSFVNQSAQTFAPLIGYGMAVKALKPVAAADSQSGRPIAAHLRFWDGRSARIIASLPASNGIAYVIDDVNLPPKFFVELRAADGKYDVINLLDKLNGCCTKFAGLFKRYFGSAMTSHGFHFRTLYLPTDYALDDVISDEEFNYLVSDRGRQRLRFLMENHVSTGKLTRDVIEKVTSSSWTDVTGDEEASAAMTSSDDYVTYASRDEGEFPIVISRRDASLRFGIQRARLMAGPFASSNDVTVVVIDKVMTSRSFDSSRASFCDRHVGDTSRVCASCNVTVSDVTVCPRHHKPVRILKHEEQPCVITDPGIRSKLGGSTFVGGKMFGCWVECADNRTVEECCPGHFGPLCRRCPGPIGNPCNGNGICDDGRSGLGTCTCNSDVTGPDCSTCVDVNKSGPGCKQDCRCGSDVGACDNRVTNKMGACRACHAPSSGGDFCDVSTSAHVTGCVGFNVTSPHLVTCHRHARHVCDTSDAGDDVAHFRCECLPGYEGDGENWCERFNPCINDPLRGGCDPMALCDVITNNSTSSLTVNCTCPPGTVGDGKTCYDNQSCGNGTNGGCHADATCYTAGFHDSWCVCNRGYLGNGYHCSLIDPCDKPENGGCGRNAVCHFDASTRSKGCSCRDGFTMMMSSYPSEPLCVTSLKEHLLLDDDVTRWSQLLVANAADDVTNDDFVQAINEIQQYRNENPTSPTRHFSIFLPHDEAWRSMDVDDYRFWVQHPQHLAILIKYHAVKVYLTVDDLIKQKKLPCFVDKTELIVDHKDPSPLPHFARFNVPHIGKERAAILQKPIATTHGVIFLIDKILLPPRDIVHDFPPISQISTESKLNEYSAFIKHLNTTGVMAELKRLSHFTLFALSNQDFDPSEVSKDVMRYHVVPNKMIRMNGFYDGEQLTTLLGRHFMVEVQRNGADRVQVNGIGLRRDGSDIRTQRGILHGLRWNLLAPTRSRCDDPDTYDVTTRCVTSSMATCGSRESCRINSPVTMRLVTARFVRCGDGDDAIAGCATKCTYRRLTPTQRCCPGYHGDLCSPCPGGIGHVCSGRGECHDGMSGNGTCTCSSPRFTGVACDECSSGRYGRDCANKCNCTEHGTCDDGIFGKGTCLCETDYYGVRCENRYDNTTSDNVIKCGRCHKWALCLPHPRHQWACECASGYRGDGREKCEVVDPCEGDKELCHRDAACFYVAPGLHRCECKAGYGGDGSYCEPIDPCAENKTRDVICKSGGAMGECFQRGPGKWGCRCQQGYEPAELTSSSVITSSATKKKAGVTSRDDEEKRVRCKEVDPCEGDEHGCHDFATCHHTGPNQHECRCMKMLVGDGRNCVGNVIFEFILMSRDRHGDAFLNGFTSDVTLRQLSNMVMDFVALEGDITLFVPANITQLRRVPQSNRRNMDNHFVACTSIYTSEHRLRQKVRTLGGEVLTLRPIDEESFYINETIRAHSPRRASNGWIYVIDDDFASLPYYNESAVLGDFPQVNAFLTKMGAAKFAHLMSVSGSSELLLEPIHNKWTLLAPTDAAFRQLDPEQLDKLNSNKAYLQETIRYHMIPQFSHKLVEFTEKTYTVATAQGSDVTIGCEGGKGEYPGSVSVNEGLGEIVNFQRVRIGAPSRVSDSVSSIFLIDKVLEAPSVGGRCDEKVYRNVTESCLLCFDEDSEMDCQQGMRVGTVACHDDRNNLFSSMFSSHRRYRECALVCLSYNITKKCCPDHYGPTCLPCPGGAGAACMGNGRCEDGIDGSGVCRCRPGFTGVACEQCGVGRWGPGCQKCRCSVHGRCHDGMSGSGGCECDAGYIGSACDIKKVDVSECAHRCVTNSVCSLNVTSPSSAECACSPGYHGDALRRCDPVVTCGNCSEAATCADDDSSPSAVTSRSKKCRCRSGYEGDGIKCIAVTTTTPTPTTPTTTTTTTTTTTLLLHR